MTEVETNPADAAKWYCLRTQQKREHIAAKILSEQSGIETYCPRISQVKKLRSGQKKRFLEALFPNYIFARFDLDRSLREVTYTTGVSYVVRLGDNNPAVADTIISQLMSEAPDGIIDAPDPAISPGAEVEVISGSLRGLSGTVLAVLPATQRVSVLLNFLGRELQVDVESSEIFKR